MACKGILSTQQNDERMIMNHKQLALVALVLGGRQTEALAPPRPLHHQSSRHCLVTTRTTTRERQRLVQLDATVYPAEETETSTAVPDHIERAWGTRPDVSNFPGANFPLQADNHYNDDPNAPVILELPKFLSLGECAFVRNWATEAIEAGADECDEYLNARVNNEVDSNGASQEGKALIDEFDLDESTLSAAHKGGFRIRLDQDLIQTLLRDRILDVLGMPGRSFVFEEGAWIRPTPRTIVVRDQTIVFYGPGNGVPPHVDGKDGTLLVYLSDVPEGVGGRTVFPEDGFAQTPVEGTALLYRSKTELLHYSEAMTGCSEKWIMQLLLDYDHDYQPGDTITDFSTGESYVWDGN